MAHYLRQDKKKKGHYLQMYESYWDKEKKQPRSGSIKKFGYVSDLISDEIPDPVSLLPKKHVPELSLSNSKKISVISLYLLSFQN